MFNPLTPSEMVTAIGSAARAAARTDEALDEFDRGQLMSAYSACRHLAIEIATFSSELSARCSAIADAVDRASGAESLHDLAARLREAGEAGDARAAGDAIAELLAACRARESRSALRGRIQAELRALCDTEVALLADGIEAGRS